ncbi:hypothetical protein K474DRAFT_1713908 [Panus rudis PR-1116 ss-1]|nr:hypothetical protein K474DRAFT_1713908 [Panus rudis PR-1116 ss-1]
MSSQGNTRPVRAKDGEPIVPGDSVQFRDGKRSGQVEDVLVDQETIEYELEHGNVDDGNRKTNAPKVVYREDTDGRRVMDNPATLDHA